VTGEGAGRDEALAYFVPEAAEHLDVMSRGLLALELGRGGRDGVASLFRAVHTLKGSAYVVGQTRIGDLAHRIEDVLAAARDDPAELTPAAIDAIQTGLEAVRRLLGLADDPSPGGAAAAGDQALALLSAVASASAPRSADAEVAAAVPVASPPAPWPSAPPVSPERGPVPRAPIAGMRLDLLMSLAGELVVSRRRLESRLRELERVSDVLSLSRTRMARAVVELEALHRGNGAGGDGAGQDFAATPLTDGALERSLEGAPARGLGARPPGAPPRGSPDSADLFADVELQRFDHVDVLGRSLGEITEDLAVVHSQVSGLARSLAEDTTRVQRLTGSLRSEITRARLVPVGRVFARVARQVQEAARSAGRAVVLEVEGETVAVDSAVVEHMAGPILHILQNAVTHGIETAEERGARGKPAAGTVSLRAYHRAGFIHVEVGDDGRGIDPALVKAAAVRQGLVPAEVAALMDDAEAVDLVFLPGLSTASAVTSSAGRGMGLDVVRTAVGRLNGDVTIATEAGGGTRFTIRLPLTVLVSEALLVRVGSETLAIPVNAVKRIVALPPDHVQRAGHAERVWVDDRSLELLRLDQLLGLPVGEPSATLHAVALRAAGRAVAVAVDELLGKEEIVLKGLGEFLDGIGPFGGATLSEDGRVILLLDPTRVVEMAEALAGVPVAAPREPEPVVASEAPVSRRVLLVDDSISVRKFVGQMLERAGFDVVTAADGVEGLQALDETAVDTVITDLEMPRLNGFELIQELRRRAQTRDLPIVVLTTRVGAQHLNLARWLGATAYVAKPVDEPAFVSLIDSLSAKRPGRR